MVFYLGLYCYVLDVSHSRRYTQYCFIICKTIDNSKRRNRNCVRNKKPQKSFISSINILLFLFIWSGYLVYVYVCFGSIDTVQVAVNNLFTKRTKPEINLLVLHLFPIIIGTKLWQSIYRANILFTYLKALCHIWRVTTLFSIVQEMSHKMLM